MRNRIIAIAVTIVFVAGAGTALGVIVKQTNDKNTEELVSVAVSEALSTTEEETTIEETTTEVTTETTTLREAKLPARTTTTTTATTMTTTTTAPAVTYGDTVTASYTTTLRKYKEANIDNNIVMVYIVKGDKSAPDYGKYCYYNKDNNLIYIDNISQIEFVETSSK